MTAYDMRNSDWSSDVCSSDLGLVTAAQADGIAPREAADRQAIEFAAVAAEMHPLRRLALKYRQHATNAVPAVARDRRILVSAKQIGKHTSELQSLMRISYAVFCLKKKKHKKKKNQAPTVTHKKSHQYKTRRKKKHN